MRYFFQSSSPHKKGLNNVQTVDVAGKIFCQIKAEKHDSAWYSWDSDKPVLDGEADTVVMVILGIEFQGNSHNGISGLTERFIHPPNSKKPPSEGPVPHRTHKPSIIIFLKKVGPQKDSRFLSDIRKGTENELMLIKDRLDFLIYVVLI